MQRTLPFTTYSPTYLPRYPRVGKLIPAMPCLDAVSMYGKRNKRQNPSNQSILGWPNALCNFQSSFEFNLFKLSIKVLVLACFLQQAPGNGAGLIPARRPVVVIAIATKSHPCKLRPPTSPGSYAHRKRNKCDVLFHVTTTGNPGEAQKKKIRRSRRFLPTPSQSNQPHAYTLQRARKWCAGKKQQETQIFSILYTFPKRQLFYPYDGHISMKRPCHPEVRKKFHTPIGPSLRSISRRHGRQISNHAIHQPLDVAVARTLASAARGRMQLGIGLALEFLVEHAGYQCCQLPDTFPLQQRRQDLLRTS